ncbi:septal ring lytic transglycosylase RlpA family protein [Stenotrophomonas sp. C3(2023)]|uniref:septal ring lytic transglycosylase RlpA family protein n=1 Tax=Stenotrophomonas sp. C3(2023) TaxID=3080277 RepID=UPI00293C8409|nr:septal ring lytic transglycosylase RlpA family protein [Stenotrophomonas sp. C3(2023)]MDV3469765.1 septal ring lytic transglycosylase RlpA family protein [Stenotrophomonas sp. C3(2023)]
MNIRWLVPAIAALALAACSSAPPRSAGPATGKPPGKVVQGSAQSSRPANCPEGSPYAAATEDPSTRGNYTAGGLYKPGVKDTTPTYVPNVACIPEPLVEALERSPIGNRSPYEVLGKKYSVLENTKGYNERGTASYYGAKFHGRLTSNREVYDMYQFTAAHKTLPLPSFARVTNLDNGESVIVRVNDRGPFHDGRVIDLSYAAAVRLGITQRGTGNVEVRALQPGEDGPVMAARPSRTERRAATVAAVAPPSTTARGPAASSAASAHSGMDRLVGRLPATTAAAPTEANPVSVAALAPPTPAGSASATTPAVAAARPAAIAAAPAASAAPATRMLGSVLLQVASFASRENAARAMGQLSAAGIVGASITDIAAGGRTLWRLRVPASDHASAAELAGRIAGLGFGAPQIVRE